MKHFNVLVCRTEDYSLMVCILFTVVLLLWLNWVGKENFNLVYDFII